MRLHTNEPVLGVLSCPTSFPVQLAATCSPAPLAHLVLSRAKQIIASEASATVCIRMQAQAALAYGSVSRACRQRHGEPSNRPSSASAAQSRRQHHGEPSARMLRRLGPRGVSAPAAGSTGTALASACRLHLQGALLLSPFYANDILRSAHLFLPACLCLHADLLPRSSDRLPRRTILPAPSTTVLDVYTTERL